MFNVTLETTFQWTNTKDVLQSTQMGQHIRILLSHTHRIVQMSVHSHFWSSWISWKSSNSPTGPSTHTSSFLSDCHKHGLPWMSWSTDGEVHTEHLLLREPDSKHRWNPNKQYSQLVTTLETMDLLLPHVSTSSWNRSRTTTSHSSGPVHSSFLWEYQQWEHSWEWPFSCKITMHSQEGLGKFLFPKIIEDLWRLLTKEFWSTGLLSVSTLQLVMPLNSYHMPHIRCQCKWVCNL